jgi:hypothetical protein
MVGDEAGARGCATLFQIIPTILQWICLIFKITGYKYSTGTHNNQLLKKQVCGPMTSIRIQHYLLNSDPDTDPDPQSHLHQIHKAINTRSTADPEPQLKGTVSRDFRPSVFFVNRSPLGP